MPTQQFSAAAALNAPPAESGLPSEQRLAREFMAYSLGLDGELSAQTHADIPLLYGTVAQVSAARQAAISAGLASHSAQPPVLMHPTAVHEAQQLGDAIARAYKTDALRDLQARRAAQASAHTSRAGDAAAGPTSTGRTGRESVPESSAEHTNDTYNAPSMAWLEEHAADAGVGAQGRVGQPVGGGSEQPEGGSAAESEGSYDDDFTDESG